MKYIRLNGRPVACPLDNALRPLTDEEFKRLDSSIEAAQEILSHIQTYISDRWGESILDGHNRARIAEARGMEALVYCRGRMSDAKAQKIARDLNEARRHFTPAELQKIRQEMITKVGEAMNAGGSQRQVAEDLQISRSQLQRYHAEWIRQKAAALLPDIPVATPGPGGPRVPTGDARQPIDPTSPTPAAEGEDSLTIQGRDGKMYPAAPKRPPPKRPASKRHREPIAIQCFELTVKLNKRVRQYFSTESNRQAGLQRAKLLNVPLGDDGRSLPWIESLREYFRQLSPGQRA